MTPSNAAEPTFRCAACGKEYFWKPYVAGRKGQCTCGAVVAIPPHAPAIRGVVAPALPATGGAPAASSSSSSSRRFAAQPSSAPPAYPPPTTAAPAPAADDAPTNPAKDKPAAGGVLGGLKKLLGRREADQ